MKHIIHECDFNQGSCISTISFAVSRTDNDTMINESVLKPPSKISQLGEPGNQIRINLTTHLGGKLSSPEFDDAWDTGNGQLEPNAKAYPERFAITVPAIEDAQAPVDIKHNHYFEIAIPNEYLALTA